MNALKIAQKYFEVSNRSDFKKISELFTQTSTYSSENTGLYLGVDSIIEMQKVFHLNFEKLGWEILKIHEEKPGIIKVDFNFSGLKNGEEIMFSGIEYIVVVGDTIQHIEIRNK